MLNQVYFGAIRLYRFFRFMKVALAQFDVVSGNPLANLRKIREFAIESKLKGARTLFLPEMCTTGFNWELNTSLLANAVKHRAAVAKLAKTLDIAICGSFLEKTISGQSANTLCYFDRSGKLAIHYRKIHLFTLFNEEKYMVAGSQIVTGETELGRIGFSICYDLRFPELLRRCALQGATIQVLPSAFPHPRLDHWQTLIRARAIENQVYVIATNQCGTENHGKTIGEVHYFGHSTVVDPWGKILIEADEEEGVFTTDIDLERVTMTRKQMPVLNDRRPEIY